MNQKTFSILIITVGFLVGFIFGNNFSSSAGYKKMKGGYEGKYSMMMKKNQGSMMQHSMGQMTMGLEGKTGDVFDQAFLTEMITHHEGAVKMAEMVLSTSKRAELLTLAKDIISAQTKEINMMKKWLIDWNLSTGSNTSTGQTVACTTEAKICPNGKAVGRTGPNCEFASCN